MCRKPFCTKRGFETQTFDPFLCKVPRNESYIKVMTLS